jgi:hypothetical protein
MKLMVFRDSLRRDARNLSKKATVTARTEIENRRRKLEARIKAFHKKADTLMNMEDAEDIMAVDVDVDVDVEDEEREELEEWAGVDPGSGGGDEAASISSTSEADVGSDQESDDEELPDYPERMALTLPSRLRRDYITRNGLETLAKQEIELRVGQANDALAALRVELGHKALLFRSKVRYSKNQKGKTRAWKEVAQSSGRVMKYVGCYQRARQALERLGADEEILEKYQEIGKEDLKMSSDMVEENRYGQRNDTLAWFWRLGPQTDAEGDSWMEECMWIFLQMSQLKLIFEGQFIG